MTGRWPSWHCTIDEAGHAAAELALPDDADSAETSSTSPFTDGGARLYVPGAHVVSTRQLDAVTEAVAHTNAARGIVCVYGDTGHGKTVAVDQALRLLPRRIPVHRALVAVKPALPAAAGSAAPCVRLARHAFDEPHGRSRPHTASGIPGSGRAGHRRRAAHRCARTGLPAPAGGRADDSDFSRAVWRRSRAHAGPRSRARLQGADLAAGAPPGRRSSPTVLRLFHPLWDSVAEADLLHADARRAKGNFRTWAKITSHAYAALAHAPGAVVDRALLSGACSRLGPTS